MNWMSHRELGRALCLTKYTLKGGSSSSMMAMAPVHTPLSFATFKVSASSKVFIGLKLDKLRLFGDELKLHSQVVTQSRATLHVIQLDISGIILVNGRLVFQSVAGLVLSSIEKCQRRDSIRCEEL